MPLLLIDTNLPVVLNVRLAVYSHVYLKSNKGLDLLYIDVFPAEFILTGALISITYHSRPAIMEKCRLYRCGISKVNMLWDLNAKGMLIDRIRGKFRC